MRELVFVFWGYVMKRLTEMEVVRYFEQAIHDRQICVHYQPQYNHSTGRLVGAEALMRWNHPEYGPQSPADFIPAMEKYELIYRADLYVFKEICRFQSNCPSADRIPISFNVSRHDLLEHDYVDELEAIRKEYNVPVQYLRVEITESSADGGFDLVATAINRFHEAGYIVEMDDFGSGYSSLGILKSLPVDVLKLDLSFLSGEGSGGQGGIILNSVIQMAKWLETQTIAEGVETVEQADFLKSVGCNYVQGYLYSKPIPEEEMSRLLSTVDSEKTEPMLKFVRGLKAKRFWNPDSMETFFFNSFTGPAAVFSYEDGDMEMLRVNEKYVRELGMNLTETEILAANPLDTLNPANRKIYLATVKKAIASGEEESCETWRSIHSGCCGEEKICIRSHIRVIGKAENQAIIYAGIHNVTCEKRQFEELAESERRFRFASEQANIYAWEYTVDTKEMRPCFRCIRDLGFPHLVRNYPEPAIKAGIIPPDYADMYRDWHKQIAAGAKKLEAIIPMTVGRVPFHVRYTTVFDETGKPLKAYGSATMVNDEKLWNDCRVYTHIAHALARGYTDLYYVNMDTDEYIEYHTDDTHCVLSEAKRGTEFFRDRRRDAEQNVYPEDRAAYVTAMDRPFLMETLRENKLFKLTYRKLKGGAPFYVLMHISRMEDDDRFLVIAVKDIDAMMN